MSALCRRRSCGRRSRHARRSRGSCPYLWHLHHRAQAACADIDVLHHTINGQAAMLNVHQKAALGVAVRVADLVTVLRTALAHVTAIGHLWRSLHPQQSTPSATVSRSPGAHRYMEEEHAHQHRMLRAQPPTRILRPIDRAQPGCYHLVADRLSALVAVRGAYHQRCMRCPTRLSNQYNMAELPTQRRGRLAC